MNDNIIYRERVSSNRTELLFVGLMLLFLSLLSWRLNAYEPDLLAAAFLLLFVLFFFYSVNYRNLMISLTPTSLTLTFGIFTWRVPLENVEDCRLDEIPLLMRLGGAGIHFMLIQNRYRASFNFLEHPRVVIAFRKKVGVVQDISFSTRRAEEIVKLIQQAVANGR